MKGKGTFELTQHSALVFGSEPFAGLNRNPASEIATQLDGRHIGGFEITGAIMPASRRAIPGRIEALLAGRDYRLVIGLGLFIGAASVRIETTAVNRVDFDVADNDGEFVRDEVIDERGPAARTVTFPARAIAEAILAKGIPARLSHHAGTHLCNFALYHALARAHDNMVGGFIHLPMLPEQVASRMYGADKKASQSLRAPSEYPSMCMELQLDAVEAAISCVWQNSIVQPSAEGLA